MKNLYQDKFTRKEDQAFKVIANFIAKFIVIILAIIFYIVKLIAKPLYKAKRWLAKLALMGIVIFFLTAFFMPVVYSPYADASHPVAKVTPTPSELENIVAYIARVFEPEGKAVVVKAINCFYSESGLTKIKVGQNSDAPKSKDHGIAQLNDYWHTLSPEEKTEIKANIDRAYEIYKNNGHTFNPWYGKGCK